jgi:ATP-dependent DNA helicase RecQ
MEPCGASCDVCSGVSMEERLSAVRAKGLDRAAGRRSRGGAERATGSALEGARFANGTIGVASDALFDKLRELRREIADRQGVPAYVVFSDRTLREMAEVRPENDDELLAVSGVGPAKLERYGERFLRAILEG